MKTLSPSPLPSPSKGDGTWLPRSKLRGIVSWIEGKVIAGDTLGLKNEFTIGRAVGTRVFLEQQDSF